MSNENKNQLHGRCGTCLLYFTNSILLVAGILTVAFISLASYTEVFSSIKELHSLLILLHNNFLTLGGIIIGCLIILFAGVGLFGTVCMRKAAHRMYTYEEQNPEVAKKHDAPCCATCTLAIYIILCFISFLLLLAVGGLATSSKTGIMKAELAPATNLGLQYFDQVVEKFVEDPNNKNTWNDIEDALVCCGWKNTDQTIIGNSTCPPKATKTCNDQITQAVEKNLVAIIATSFSLAFLCLVCFICAIVVRFAISKQKRIKESNNQGNYYRTEDANDKDSHYYQ